MRQLWAVCVQLKKEGTGDRDSTIAERKKKRNTRAYAQQRTPALQIQETGGSGQGGNTAGNYETCITYKQTRMECEGDIVTYLHLSHP